jgi:hypothetical protein
VVLGLTVGAIAMTARPAPAAGAVFTCYTRVGTNFLISGLVVKLMATAPGGTAIELNRSVTDAQGCAVMYVPPQFYNSSVYTVINNMDTNYFYGSYYNGWSYAASVWSQPRNGWVNYGQSTNGYALPGTDIWYLFGTVSCQTCRW